MQKPRYSQQVQPRYSQQVDRVYQLAWLREFRAILWKREARGKQQRRDAKLYSRTGTLSTDVPGHLRQAQVTGSKKPLTEQMEETSRQAENNAPPVQVREHSFCAWSRTRSTSHLRRMLWIQIHVPLLVVKLFLKHFQRVVLWRAP